MRLLALFLQYDTVKYPGAYERLHTYLSAIAGVDWILFQIDNAQAFSGVRAVSANEYAMGGDNSCWEFSGWRIGLEQANAVVSEYDGVLFVNDAFEVSGPSLLSRLSGWYIKLMLRLNIPIGGLDRTVLPGELAGRTFQKWIRSNCFILSRACAENIKLVSVNEAGIDEFIDREFQGTYFKRDAPLSENLRVHIERWLSIYWHSAFCLEENWEFFRNKTRAILNEFFLGMQIMEHSRIAFDHRPFLYNSLRTFISILVIGTIGSAKKRIKSVVKSILGRRVIEAIRSVQAIVLKKIEYPQAAAVVAKIRECSGQRNVVLLEPNETHAEVLPGLAAYFLDAGYHVHVVLRHSMAEEQPFCRFMHERLHLYSCGRYAAHFIFDFLGRDIDLTVVTSSLEYITGNHDFLEKHSCLTNTKYGTVVVLHAVGDSSSSAVQTLVDAGRSITLRRLSGSPKSFSVVPLYFGPVMPHKKNKRTTFIAVGAIHSARRDYGMLFRSVRSLLRTGEANFTVVLAGGCGDVHVPADLRCCITVTGRISFPELYRQTGEADFLLPLLNMHNAEHLGYMHIRASGSRQLIFGFTKPCVLSRPFAEAFSVTEDCGILYDGSELTAAMRQAIGMSREEYEACRQAVAQRASELYDESAVAVRDMLQHVSTCSA